MPTPKKAAPRTRQPDAIALLKADHAEVKAMYKRYQELVDKKAAASTRQKLATQICTALKLHAQLEEELIYPAAREVINDVNIVDHADVEHASAKELIAQIEAMQPNESHYDAKVCVLCEYVAHHVKEEETEMFPKLRKSSLDLKALGAQLADRKAELAGR